MLLSTFISRALSYASVDGAPFIDSDAERQTFVGVKLAEFTIDCPCIFHDDISMAVVSGTRLYNFDTYSATFTRSGQTVMALTQPVQVWSPSGALLSDGRGYPGPTPSEEVEDNRLSLTTTGTPSRWGVHAPGVMYLLPIPTATATWRVSAWAQHPQITTSTVASSTTISIPKVAETAALRFVAALLMDPLATGTGEGRANVLLKQARAQMAAITADMARYRHSRTPRGRRDTIYPLT